MFYYSTLNQVHLCPFNEINKINFRQKEKLFLQKKTCHNICLKKEPILFERDLEDLD